MALNEKEVVDITEDHTITQYEYDWNEFKDDNLTLEDVLENPSKFLEYDPKPTPEPTKENIYDVVKELETKQDIAEQAIQDLMLLMMGE